MKLTHLKCISTLVIGLMTLVSFSTVAGEMPMVSDAWVRSAPASVKMHAGYLTLHNNTKTEVGIVGVRSPQYAQAEIHHSSIVDGVATMTRQDQITLSPGAMLKMAPGGFHLMLMHPKAHIRIGDTIDIELQMANGEALSFNAVVRKMAGMSHDGHSGHKMN